MICFLAGSSHIMLAAMQKSKGHLCELEPGLPAAAALSAAPPSAEPHAPMQTRFSAAALPAPVPCCTTDSVAAHLIINQSISQPIKSINLQSVNQSFYISCFWDSSGESTDIDWENKRHQWLMSLSTWRVSISGNGALRCVHSVTLLWCDEHWCRQFGPVAHPARDPSY
jgi:hypothetical protein